LPTAANLNQEALALAREIHDAPSEAHALWIMLLQAYFTGRTADAIRFGHEGLAIADREGRRDLRGYILNDMSRAMMSAESIPVAMHALAEARAIFKELEIMPMLADNLGSTAEAAMLAGDFDTSDKYAHEGLELCETIGNLWNLCYINGTQMQIAQVRGRARETFEFAKRIDTLAPASGFFVSQYISILLQSNLLGEFGAYDRGIELVEKIKPTENFPLFDSWRFGTIARLLTLKGDFEGAHRIFERAHSSLIPEDISNYGPVFVAISSAELALAEKRYEMTIHEAGLLLAIMEKTGVCVYLPQMLLLSAQGYVGLGVNLELADANLQRAEDLARGMQANLILWQILACKAELAELRGEDGSADTARAESRAIVDGLAAWAPDELRATFLARPQVQAILQAD
jgi:tetratricopeptide (TPR) repeat protein